MKFQGDVRPLSNNPAYMGVVFSGAMKNAIKQSKAAPDHGLAPQHVPGGMSRGRAVLLQHLNLLPLAHRKPPKRAPARDKIGEIIEAVAKRQAIAASREAGIYAPGFYSVANAKLRGWI